MDVVLKVLEGAKTGTKIAVKKDEFLVGRSQKCQLCVGSSSVSRRHCALVRKDSKLWVKDLGSRNGTLVNGEKIDEKVELRSGDELGIGTLQLLVTISAGIKNQKKPKVKTVADAVERTVATGDSSVGEEDITQWLLDSPSPSKPSQAANETQTIQLDDTNAIQLKKEAEAKTASDSDVLSGDSNASTKEGSGASTKEGSDVSAGSEEGSDSDVESGKGKKKKPGKLPPRPTEPGSKDSREAAMQALRNWNRRR